MRRRALLCSPLALMVAGCLPRDPEGSLARVRTDGTLRVGASPAPPVVLLLDDGVAGPEPGLIAGYADSLGAVVEWTVAGEQHLVEKLEHYEIDVMIGGLTSDTPWQQRVGITRPYAAVPDGDGHGEAKLVMAVPMGENALLSSLERYLDSRVGP
ncbi:ABC transporter substrate-binding protein [Microlunatus sp. Y2014]|uniref:ABC transporter substrate-binding protein n=1 Tax=Microlunatus sp. Y2014 TaxID=3418488 RepID=UPI003DA793B7